MNHIPFEGNAEFPSKVDKNKDLILFLSKYVDRLHARLSPLGIWGQQVKTS